MPYLTSPVFYNGSPKRVTNTTFGRRVVLLKELLRLRGDLVKVIFGFRNGNIDSEIGCSKYFSVCVLVS